MVINEYKRPDNFSGKKKGNNANFLRAINSKIIFHDEKFKQRN